MSDHNGPDLRLARLVPPPSKMEEGLIALRDGLPFMLEYQRVLAKVQRERFNALVAEGFSEEQALVLVNGMGLA